MKQLQCASLPALVALAICGTVGWTAVNSVHWTIPTDRSGTAGGAQLSHDLDQTVERVNGIFEQRWASEQIAAADPADDIQVLRRLSLALFGTIPALEEIREFTSDSEPDRRTRWTLRMLADERWADYFAERLSVAFIGDRENEVPGFRRERFIAWLAEDLRGGQPYDDIVRRAIAATGLPTVSGPANFLTAEISQGDEYASRLGGRVARAFLGQRIDCAECHDHPFAEWKQTDFQGLAAFFGELRRSGSGVFDDRGREHLVEDRDTLEKRAVKPRVPFDDAWLSGSSRRQQLAAWVTHHENRRFRRAIANRVWALMFGRPFVTPVDDIPNPPPAGEMDETELLDVLGDDLATNGFDIRRLALVIATSKPFRLASTHASTAAADEHRSRVAQWAVFPVVQLRPEQVARSMLQLQTLKTLRLDDNVLSHTYRFHWMREFAEQYGSLGELELDEQSASIQQMLIRMSGRFTRESIQSSLRSATHRIATAGASDAECVDACFLVGFTRPPTADERKHFLDQLRTAGGERRRVVEDIFWAMLNSPEFVWNH